MARQLAFTKLQLWHMVPIAALCHGALLYFPIQVGTTTAQKPKTAPPSIKVATLPSPKPSPTIQPSLQPIVKPSLPPVVQPQIVQPQRTIVLPQPSPQPTQAPITQPSPQATPSPIAQASPQVTPSPVAQPSATPTPPQELNTSSDMLTNLGGRSCGFGCFQIADKTVGDVVSEFERQFRNRPQEIRDSNTDELLGYIVTNRKGEAEYVYYTSQANTTPGEPGLVHSFKTLKEHITDRQQLNTALSTM